MCSIFSKALQLEIKARMNGFKTLSSEGMNVVVKTRRALGRLIATMNEDHQNAAGTRMRIRVIARRNITGDRCAIGHQKDFNCPDRYETAGWLVDLRTVSTSS